MVVKMHLFFTNLIHCLCVLTFFPGGQGFVFANFCFLYFVGLSWEKYYT